MPLAITATCWRTAMADGRNSAATRESGCGNSLSSFGAPCSEALSVTPTPTEPKYAIPSGPAPSVSALTPKQHWRGLKAGDRTRGRAARRARQSLSPLSRTLRDYNPCEGAARCCCNTSGSPYRFIARNERSRDVALPCRGCWARQVAGRTLWLLYRFDATFVTAFALVDREPVHVGD